jgi:metal-dependent amidase/aminoacylase/carboxypeptidase family protein
VDKNIHAHPELSTQGTRTAGLAAERLRGAGYEVTTGVGELHRLPALFIGARKIIPDLRTII